MHCSIAYRWAVLVFPVKGSPPRFCGSEGHDEVFSNMATKTRKCYRQLGKSNV